MSHKKYVIIRKSKEDHKDILSSAVSYIAKDVDYKKREACWISEAVWASYTEDERKRILSEAQVIVYGKKGKAMVK